jgi:hypothetical protein
VLSNLFQTAGLAHTIKRLASDARIPHFQQTFDNEPLDRAYRKMQFTCESRTGEAFHMDTTALAKRGEVVPNGGLGAMQHFGNHPNPLITGKVKEGSVVIFGPGEARTLLATFGNSLNEPVFSCVLPDYVRPPVRMAP